jgi:hypothetical protein
MLPGSAHFDIDNFGAGCRKTDHGRRATAPSVCQL